MWKEMFQELSRKSVSIQEDKLIRKLIKSFRNTQIDSYQFIKIKNYFEFFYNINQKQESYICHMIRENEKSLKLKSYE